MSESSPSDIDVSPETHDSSETYNVPAGHALSESGISPETRSPPTGRSARRIQRTPRFRWNDYLWRRSPDCSWALFPPTSSSSPCTLPRPLSPSRPPCACYRSTTSFAKLIAEHLAFPPFVRCSA